MGKKKNRKDITQRREKANAKKQQKRKLKLLKSKPPSSEPQYLERPAFADMEVPDGFRVVSISQAMGEYAQPLLDRLRPGDFDTENTALQLSTKLWNYSIALDRDEAEPHTKTDIIKLMQQIFAMGDLNAEGLFQTMVDRKEFLFPPDIQPEFPMQMFMRKEVSYLIRPFDYSRLKISSELIPPSEQDIELVKQINILDNNILYRADYSEYENLFLSLQEDCCDQFKEWLIAKKAVTYSEDFGYCIFIYWDFIYGYMHDGPVILKNVLPPYLEEFFMDYVLRKVLVEPSEYVYWPAAVKLFYLFLGEIGYLDNPEIFIQIIDEMEPEFVEVLRKRFV